jgi:hypothetical protein
MEQYCVTIKATPHEATLVTEMMTKGRSGVEDFAKVLYLELTDSRGLQLTEDEVLTAVREADEKASPGPFATLEASHKLLDQVGVPRQYSDGTQAPVDARLVAFIRHVQGRLAGGGCGGRCPQ